MEILVNTIFRKGIQIGPDPCQNGCCDGVTTIGNGYVVTDAVCACTFGFKDGNGTVASWSDLAQKVYENGGSCWTGSGGGGNVSVNSNIRANSIDSERISACSMVVSGGINLCSFTSITTQNGNVFNLPQKSGTIALTSDITVKPVKQSRTSITAGSDCTFFKVVISESPNTIINKVVEKIYTSTSGCKLIEPCFWENTDMDIFQSSQYSNSTFFIRKDSGIAMPCSSNGEFYELIVTYV